MPLGRMKPPRRVVALFLMLVPTGCSEDGRLIGPQNQMEVTNATDSFQWQVSALSRVSQTLTYTWEHTGTVASVNQASAIAGGSATLRVTDSQGLEVYARGLQENGTFETAPGSPGGWTVTITLTNATGTLNFRLQKP